jgi:hypothetical protein
MRTDGNTPCRIIDRQEGSLNDAFCDVERSDWSNRVAKLVTISLLIVLRYGCLLYGGRTGEQLNDSSFFR